jgi:hypothetical protein
MRTLVLSVLTGVALALVPAGTGAPSAPSCPIVRPTTVSPTNSRLWSAYERRAWVAGPEFVNPDGSIWLKAPWFAQGPRGGPERGPRGTLWVTGKRLDRTAPRLRAQTRQVGVEGFRGSGVWAAVLTFPTEGCWSVNGRVERTTHTFRLLVTRAPA